METKRLRDYLNGDFYDLPMCTSWQDKVYSIAYNGKTYYPVNIKIIEGDAKPEYHKGSYEGRITNTYIFVSDHITVGKEWLRDNLTPEEWADYVTKERLL